MAFEMRDNSGSVFVNDRKTEDRHPDRSGKAMIGGVMYWVSGWLKKTQSGTPWLSLSFKPMEPRGEESQVPPASQASDPLAEEIPF